ncbi:sugar transferase [Candidatus Margulisiibacteriota bacterium]
MIKLVIDIFIINLSFVMAYYLRFNLLTFLPTDLVPGFDLYLSGIIFITILWLAVFNLVGFYKEKRGLQLIDELAKIFAGVTLASILLFSLLFLYRSFWFSRLLIVNAWWISFVLIGFSRIALSAFQQYLYSCGIKIKRVLILGHDEMAQFIFSKLEKNKALGYVPVGYVDPDTVEIKQKIELEEIDELIITTSNLSHQRILDIITECEVLNIGFKIVPGILELMASRVDVDEVAGIPLVTISEIGLSGIKALVKRSFDIIFSSVLLIILTPLFLIVALLIKLDSVGPVLYCQDRVGKDGRRFNCYKFRSMVVGADKLKESMLEQSDVDGHIFKIKADPRMTKFGNLIRKFSIDELPQLYNVLVGEMSLVGPRPPLPKEVKKYSTWHKKRLRVTPGITGLWQVSGRSHLPFEDMIRLDIYYIENWSLWLDIKILFKTIPVVLIGSGAY